MAIEQLNFLLEGDIKSEICQISDSMDNGIIVKSESVLNGTSTEVLPLYNIEFKDDKTSFSAQSLSLKSETKNYGDQLVLMCFDCQKNYFSKKDIERHVQSGLCGGVSCDVCWKEFLNKEQLSEHFQFSCLIFSVNGGDRIPRTGGFVCLECGLWRPTKLLLEKHEATHQLKTCDHCYKTVHCKGKLRSHMRTHWPPEQHQCDICFRIYRQSRTLVVHKKRVHEGRDPFECKICKQTFSSCPKLSLHLRIHRGEGPCKCQICGKTYPTPSILKAHVSRHTEERPFKCEACSKSFKTIYGKRQHARVHTREQFTCNICSKTVAISYRHCHLKSHLGNCECQICHLKCINSDALARHVKSVHDSLQYKCHDCWKTFAMKDYLRLHVIVHLDYKHFRCEVCGKDFKRQDSKVAHMTTHSDELPFECEFYGEKFKRKWASAEHRRDHTGEKPYACELCHMTFAKRGYRLKHFRGHAGSFKCEECGESFLTKTKLSWHVVSKHETKEKCRFCGVEVLKMRSHIQREHRYRNPFSCKICKSQFFRLKSAKSHLQTVHNTSALSNLAGGDRIETEKRIFRCQFCDMNFSRSDERVKHLKCHFSFKCDECGDNFETKSKLSWHVQRKHAPKNKCNICGKEVKCLQGHISSVHSKRDPFFCKICGKKLSSKRAVERHMRFVHSDTKNP